MALLDADIWKLTLTLAVGLVPALIWLWFWLKQDQAQPEPKKMILLTFILGGLVTFPAGLLSGFYLEQLEIFFDRSLNFRNPEVAIGITPTLYVLIFLIGAFFEETLKLIAAGPSFLSRFFDEPIDAMIYLITAGLGFAAFENALYFSFFLPDEVFLSLSQITIRFLGSTILHTVCSAIIGAFIAFNWHRSFGQKLLATGAGLILATFLHTAFNFSIMNLSANYSHWLTFLTLWVVAIIIILLFEKVKRLKY